MASGLLKRAVGPLAVVLGLAAAPVANAGSVAEVQRVVSPGGIEAWLVEDDLVPVVALSVAWRGGAVADPDGLEGLANMASALLDEGAGDLDSAAFQQRLEDEAISIRFSAGYDVFGGELKALREDLDEAFALFSLAITAPRFDDEPIGRVRAQIKASVLRDDESPSRVAFKRWRSMMYGAHPYGRPTKGTLESLDAIDRAALSQFVERRLARDNLLISVAGDITADELGALLDRTFGGLPARAAPVEIESAELSVAGETLLVRRPVPQAWAVFGHIGIDRDDPDFYTAYLMNYILGGGGLSARLTEEVREKRGLAYSLWTSLSPGDYGDVILGSVGSRNATIDESLTLVRGEWERMARDGVTQAELDRAREAVIGTYLLGLTSTDGIAGAVLSMRVNELGRDYMVRREGYFRAVTVDDVKRVARRILDEDALSVVIVGDPEAITTGFREDG